MAFLVKRQSNLPAARTLADREPGHGQLRALAGSAETVLLGDRGEARRILQARQVWQLEAWAYRRSLGELRYATNYLSNSVMRLRLHPATYVEGEAEPVELTAELAQRQGIPADLQRAAVDALNRLGSGGPLAMAQIQKKLTDNFEVAGECYLVGEVDPLSNVENWGIRSVSELVITESGRYGLRDTPNTAATDSTAVRWLDPHSTVVVRLWWPDPEFAMLADSPVRAILDLCEELLLLGRDVRATARSRLANNGVLFLPESLTVIAQAPGGDGGNAQLDPFMAEFTAAATSALSNEGSASAVVPIMARGPAEAINAVKHLMLQRPANTQNIGQRQELINRMATGIDLPAEVLSGKAGLNHWSAWQVDDDTFRHHIEPIAVVEVDALTAGYLWTSLTAQNERAGRPWTVDQIRQVLVWYDPTALVTHPDRTKDATAAMNAGAISRKAYRKYYGMPEDDSPDELDELLYILQHARGVPPPILIPILKSVATTIAIPDANQLTGAGVSAQLAPGQVPSVGTPDPHLNDPTAGSDAAPVPGGGGDGSGDDGSPPVSPVPQTAPDGVVASLLTPAQRAMVASVVSRLSGAG